MPKLQLLRFLDYDRHRLEYKENLVIFCHYIFPAVAAPNPEILPGAGRPVTSLQEPYAVVGYAPAVVEDRGAPPPPCRDSCIGRATARPIIGRIAGPPQHLASSAKPTRAVAGFPQRGRLSAEPPFMWTFDPSAGTSTKTSAAQLTADSTPPAPKDPEGRWLIDAT